MLMVIRMFILIVLIPVYPQGSMGRGFSKGMELGAQLGFLSEQLPQDHNF